MEKIALFIVLENISILEGSVLHWQSQFLVYTIVIRVSKSNNLDLNLFFCSVKSDYSCNRTMTSTI